MTTTPRLARAITVHQTWWEDNDWWDGYGFYLDLDTAKAHAAFAYEGDEYGHPDEDDDEEPAARPDFTWEFGHGQWMLLDHGKDTLVRVIERGRVPPGHAPRDRAAGRAEGHRGSGARHGPAHAVGDGPGTRGRNPDDVRLTAHRDRRPSRPRGNDGTQVISNA